VMLEHMMISHHYEPEYGSPKRPLFPEAEVLHYMDMLDAKLYDFEDSLAGVAPGGFSDWVRTLDGRRLYKSKGSGLSGETGGTGSAASQAAESAANHNLEEK